MSTAESKTPAGEQMLHLSPTPINQDSPVHTCTDVCVSVCETKVIYCVHFHVSFKLNSYFCVLWLGTFSVYKIQFLNGNGNFWFLVEPRKM